MMVVRQQITPQDGSDFLTLPEGAEGFGLLIAAVAAVALITSVLRWHSSSFLSCGLILVLAVLFSGVAIGKTSSSSLPAVVWVVLFGMTRLTPSETVLVAAVVTWMQSWSLFGCNIKMLQHMLFRTGLMVLGAALAEEIYPWLNIHGGQLAGLTVAALTIFLVTTIPPALVIAVREDKAIGSVWGTDQLTVLPYYVLGAVGVYLLSLPATLFGS